MKKFFTAVLCASMVLGITGCGQSDASDKRSSKDVKKEKLSVEDIMAEFDYDLRFRKDTGRAQRNLKFWDYLVLKHYLYQKTSCIKIKKLPSVL